MIPSGSREEREDVMDRSHSKFPAGSVGLALFLLRLAAAFGLVSEGVQLLANSAATTPSNGTALLGLGLVASAIMLLLGLRTTLSGSAAAVFSAAAALYGTYASTRSSYDVDAWLFLFAVVFVLSGALALTGPGGYSLDARLTGWRQIKLRSGKSNPPNPWETFS
jgi:uncharacterized membrane protein YphA (DoxX/SURF4 family)